MIFFILGCLHKYYDTTWVGPKFKHEIHLFTYYTHLHSHSKCTFIQFLNAFVYETTFLISFSTCGVMSVIKFWILGYFGRVKINKVVF